MKESTPEIHKKDAKNLFFRFNHNFNLKYGKYGNPASPVMQKIFREKL
jgi:hypothetical protein